MCLSPIKVNYHDKYKKFRGTLIHSYNNQQILPCGKCYKCVELKIEQWQIRWKEQLKTSIPDTSYLLTLTYNDQNIPEIITPDGEIKTSLDYTDVQKFLKRLRKRQEKISKINSINNPKISYHGCGEYGKQFTKRPHYHILITNLIIDPQEIQSIWGKGNVHVGDSVNEHTIKYVLKYTLKSALEQQNKIKAYQKTQKTIKFSAYPEEQKYHSQYQKLGVIYHNPQIKEQNIEIKHKKLFEYYKKNVKNEYRIAEKSFVSKGIGKNFVTEEIIKQYHQNPSMNYLDYDTQKQTYKQRPLPRYYREIIFNPKFKDSNGKYVRDEYGRYKMQYDPLNPDYENTPRFKKQLEVFRNQQEAIKQTLLNIQYQGYEQYLKNQRQNKENALMLFKKAKQEATAIQNHRNLHQGVAQLI